MTELNQDEFDENGFDKNGYNKDGVDKNGLDKNGINRKTEQEFLDSIFAPGELEAITKYHRNEQGHAEPQLPPDWTEQDSIDAKKRIEEVVGGFRRFKMDVDKQTLVDIFLIRAKLPAGYPEAKEAMRLPAETRLIGYDALRDWFVDRGYDIPEADLAAELSDGFVGTYDDVFEEIQTIDSREAYSSTTDEEQERKKYLLKLRELGVTKIDTDYHRERRTMLLNDPVARELALRMQRQNPSEVMEDNDIYAHDVEVEGMECPEEYRRSDHNRHKFNPDNLDYVGYQDNSDEEVKDNEIDPLAPTPIPEILKDLDDYAEGGPKQYKHPESMDSTYYQGSDEENKNSKENKDKETYEDGGIYNPELDMNAKEKDDLVEDEHNNERSNTVRPDIPKAQGGTGPRPSGKEHEVPRGNMQQGSSSVMPSDMLGFGALGNLVGRGVKGVANLAGNSISKGSSLIASRQRAERANNMAKISVNEISRANVSAKEALDRVKSRTNKSGEPASEMEQSQNIAELDLSLNNLGQKLKMGEESVKNPKVGFDEKKEILKNISDSGSIGEDVNKLPDDIKENLSEQAKNIAKIIADLIKKIFSKSSDKAASPSM